MKKKNKYWVGNGLLFSIDKNVSKFEKFANEGYRLAGVNRFGIYKFVYDGNPGRSYAIDIADICLDSNHFQDYLEIFESAGWKHIFSSLNAHYFTAEKGTLPIYTDKKNEVVKYKNLFYTGRKGAAFLLTISVIFFSLFFLFNVMQFELPFAIYLLFLGITGGSLGGGLMMLYGTILNYYRIKKKIKYSL